MLAMAIRPASLSQSPRPVLPRKTGAGRIPGKSVATTRVPQIFVPGADR